MKRTKRQNGFTLLELILVVIILSTLAMMVVPRLMGRSEEARLAAARADVRANISTALDLYELDNGQYPSTAQGLAALKTRPEQPPSPRNWRGPYMKKGSLKDPWGNPYQYRAPGTHNADYDLSSLGPDGVVSADDVTDWEDADKP